MKHFLSPLILTLPLALMACVMIEPVPGGPLDPATDACGASGLQGLVGQHARVLNTMRFAVPVRVIEAGMAVTMDYSAERLNIWLDEDRFIERVTCG
jgi:Peptidase inhibitor I78 family